VNESPLARKSKPRHGGRTQLFVTAVAALLTIMAIVAANAAAVTDAEELTRFGSVGTGAGQLKLPNAMASDPTTGHLFVPDTNNRINEFTPWGAFVKAFGWDVAPGAVNEQQEIRVRATAGQFKLSFGADSSADLPFDASAAEVETALNGLASIGSGGGVVSVKEAIGAANGVTPFIYVVVFKGTLAGKDLAQLSAANGTTPLSGGVPTASLVARTLADGTAGGTGLESCTEESGCKAGLAGSGPGEFSDAVKVAVATDGNIYVREFFSNRVQKFDPAGRFLLMFGGGVNQTTGADVCTREDVEVDHDICGVGNEGSGQGEFSNGSGLALGIDGTVFVSDVERIEEFEPNGTFKGEVKVPGETVRGLAVSPLSHGFYATYAGKDNVAKLSSSGMPEGSCEVKTPRSLDSDSAGNLYVVGTVPEKEGSAVDQVFEFTPNCEQIASLAEAELLPGTTSASRFFLYGLGTNAAGDLYVANGNPNSSPSGVPFNSFIRAFGPAPVSFESPPKVAPEISAQFASSVLPNGATVAALINPHFWTDTRYYVQYGTGKCSEGGCDKEQPAAPGQILTPKVSGSPVRSAGVFIDGLAPGATYHYRFVAQSGGGGPTVGSEATFTTFPAALPARSCPNEAFRAAAAARLPDCRAYELVSPVDKNNGDIKSLIDFPGYPTQLSQSAVAGDKLTYSSYRSFGNPKGAPYTNQFIASRDPASGWSSEAIAAPQGPAAASIVELAVENPYKAFSADLCSGWQVVASEPPLAPGAVEGFRNLYRRDNCAGGYEALIGVKPNVASAKFQLELQGTSADSREALLRVKDKLTPDAASGVFQTYYASGGELRLLCVLPDGTPNGGSCSGGTAPSANDFSGSELNRNASVANALSADGSRAYWTASVPTQESGVGKVYLRLNPGEEQSALNGGECTEPDKACTVEVSGTKSSKAARFLGASDDGSKALFQVVEGTLEGKIFEYSLGAGSTQIAGKVLGVAGTSEDLSHVYFVSEEVLPGTTGASAGKPNFYLSQEGTSSFIATLSRTDVKETSNGSDIDARPVFHVARASGDGRVLAFISTARLNGYDNTDAASPLPCGVVEGAKEGICDSEVYLYEAGAEGPHCVSCNPSGAQPQGRTVRGLSEGALATAASIPPAQNQLYFSRVLSADGERLFFNSYDALLPRDTNGKQDVYEWERAADQGECAQKGAELYSEAAGGCLSLISSGESPQDSEFLDASLSGEDVFFTTNASLLPQDPGLIDVYDARVNGGFAQPTVAAACEGEACQGPLAAPNDPTPASAAFKGAGNVREPPKLRCPKGKSRRKGRCAAHGKHEKNSKSKRANNSRRAK
jgi:hypothetical protein